MTSPAPTAALASKPLPDPASLTPTQRRAIRLAHTRHMMAARGGYRSGQDFVSTKTAEALEGLGLVRRVHERARYWLHATGSGIAVLGIIDVRQERKGARP